MATPGMSMARTTRETKTSTPGIPLHVTRSSVEKGKQVVLPGGLTDISEISSEGGHESASGSGISGVTEISPKKIHAGGAGRSHQMKRVTTGRTKETSFINPFELSLDVSVEEDEEEESDDYYEPSINITMGPKDFESIQQSALGDVEFGGEESSDDENDKEKEDTGGPGIRRIHEQTELFHLTRDSCCIVYVECLKNLASIKVECVCDRKGCKQQVEMTTSTVGSAFYLTWKCLNGHIVYKWVSQPVLNRGLHGGDLLSAAAIVASGNNFAKIALFAKFMKLNFLGSNTFTNIQRQYVVPSIEELWESKQQNVIRTCRNQDLVILGDGRMDSPGFSAQYCSYTAMDNSSKKILTVRTVDKRETQLKSTTMEKEGFQRVMKELKDKQVKVTEVVTDAHISIGALMKKEYPHIKHSFDIWHAAKNLGKKVVAVSRTLQLWSHDIVNHFWYCCQHANTYDEFIDLWASILHHVVNEHEWILPYAIDGHARCLHGPLTEEERTKEWLSKGSQAHGALRKLVLDDRFLGKVSYFLNFRSTAELENFHQLVLMYCAKRFSYTPPVYNARILLAAMDYNENVEKPVKRNKDDSIRYQRNFNKKSGRWAVHPVKEKKTYAHVEQLLETVAENRLADKAGMGKKAVLASTDPRNIRKTIAPVTPPPTSQLVETQKSRLKESAMKDM
ncbi:hypothetical protein ScPMuIL_005150 [Solemya velum]